MTARAPHLLALLLSATASAGALAQAPAPYPTKPVRLVVPYTPGASNDTLSRATAQSMGPLLGQSITTCMPVAAFTLHRLPFTVYETFKELNS